MRYEIDFLGIDKETEKDADAICFRYFDSKLNRFRVGVYDGGCNDHGEALKDHLNRYYFNGMNNPKIDFVICSHSDQDHASGLAVILENFKVERLYMNRPWLYVEEVFDKVNDGRITKKSLVERLKNSYPYVAKLEEIAISKGIAIKESFRGKVLSDSIFILSPSKEFYLKLLVESSKTDLSFGKSISESIISKYKRVIETAIESWTKELLHEEVSTSPENEMSIVIFGDMEDECFLLTGDVGIRGLNEAVDFMDILDIDKDNIKFIQIPHHGGRHNVSPSLLNRLIGNVKPSGTTTGKVAYVSVSKNSDHPKQMVVNAFLRRGVKVIEARDSSKVHYHQTPQRDGWINAVSLNFNHTVESWEEN